MIPRQSAALPVNTSRATAIASLHFAKSENTYFELSSVKRGLNSPKHKIIVWSKFKAYVDDNKNFTEKFKFVLEKVSTMVSLSRQHGPT